MIENRVLIIGASGFVGNTLYRELLPYYDVFGTYCAQEGLYGDNQVFHKFDAASDDLYPLLDQLRPGVVISAFRSDGESSMAAHRDMVKYISQHPGSQLLFSSSWAVFDAVTDFAATEFDKPFSCSVEGKQKIAIERLLLEKIPAQTAILRIPIILGTLSPQVVQLQQAIRHKASFEVFPNYIVSVTTADKLAQQVHYIVNQQRTGIFHLASRDVIHHDELFREIARGLSERLPLLNFVYDSNELRYRAILPRENKLPEAYQITVSEAIDHTTLNEQIITLKHKYESTE